MTEHQSAASQVQDVAITTDPESLRLLYVENAKMTHVFFEWRHKVLTRFFVGVSACLVGARWIFLQPELKAITFIPLLLAAVVAAAAALMDRVNQRILNHCYQTGRDLEVRLADATGVFGNLSRDYFEAGTRKTVSYRVVLEVLYWGTAVAIILFTLVVWRKL